MTQSDHPILRELIDGNTRYVNGDLQHPHSDATYRRTLVKEQKPIAAILGCSDSRVPLEMIFDQGLGDIFVIRVAGNIANEDTIASVEFAIEELHVPLIMVMGHSRCGAVTAAIQPKTFTGHLRHLIDQIRPAVRRAGGREGDLLDNAIRINAQIMAQQLIDRSDLISQASNTKQTKIVAAYYDLDTGVVEVLDEL